MHQQAQRQTVRHHRIIKGTVVGYESYPPIDSPSLKEAASELGLNRAELDPCLDGWRMAAQVRANETEARRLGLRGTPGFAIDGAPLPAPPSFSQLAQVIESTAQ